MIRLEMDVSDLLDVAKDYARTAKDADKIMSMSINDVTRKGNTQVRKKTAHNMGVAVGRIRRFMRINFARPSRLRAEIVGFGRALPLKEFKAKQGARGVSASPWRKRRLFPSTFIVRSYGGHVFRRVGKARGPIEKLYGPSVPGEMDEPEVFAELDRLVGAELPGRVMYHIMRRMK